MSIFMEFLRHGRLDTISAISCCHVPPGFVNSSDMPEAIKLNVMSSGISLDRCLMVFVVFMSLGSVVW